MKLDTPQAVEVDAVGEGDADVPVTDVPVTVVPATVVPVVPVPVVSVLNVNCEENCGIF